MLQRRNERKDDIYRSAECSTEVMRGEKISTEVQNAREKK